MRLAFWRIIAVIGETRAKQIVRTKLLFPRRGRGEWSFGCRKQVRAAYVGKECRRREIFAGEELVGQRFLLGEETTQERRFGRVRHGWENYAGVVRVGKGEVS